MDANKRIAFNTTILYIKLVTTIAINLYSTRLILSALGVEDFGIVNLIGGIVAMLSFMQNSMAVSTQRYMSYSLGKKDGVLQKQIFNSSLVLHLILALIIFAALEAATPLIFSSSIQIPVHRIIESKILYQLTILATCTVIITVPYDASLNAHEEMLVFSIVTIIESFIRLAGAFILLSYGHDRLIFYGFLIIAIRLFSLIAKWFFCSHHYDDSRIDTKSISKTKIKEMASFAGWNMLGSFAFSVRSEGVAIVLNMFKGVIINAAYGIANQVSGQLSNFTATITKAMAPQIMQSKGCGDNERMLRLSLKQCKYSFMLLLMAIVPLYIDMPILLEFWLKEVPDNTVFFCRIILLVALVQQLTSGIQTAIQANGKIAGYQVSVALILLLNIPCAYLLLKLDFPAYTVLFSMLLIEVACFVIRILFANKLVSLKWRDIVYSLLVPVVFLSISSVIIIICVQKFINIDSKLMKLLVDIVVSLFFTGVVSFVVLSRLEKEFIKSTVKDIKSRLLP